MLLSSKYTRSLDLSHRLLQGFSKILREFRGYLDLLRNTLRRFPQVFSRPADRQNGTTARRTDVSRDQAETLICRSSDPERYDCVGVPRRPSLFDRVREAETTVRRSGDAATLDRRKLTTRRSAPAPRRRAPRR